MDQDYWARRALLDPENIAAKQNALLARARIEGPGVFRDFLSDRQIWTNLAPGIQDLVIGDIREQLSPRFKHLSTDSYKCGRYAHRIASFVHVKSGMLFHLLPGGSITMSYEDESKPQPLKTLNVKPFLLGRYPVTQRQWTAQGHYNSSHFEDPQRPMESVSWTDCQEWLSSFEDGLRLPTEEEWEFACRAGSRDKFFWGGSIDGQRCWYYRNCRAGLASSEMRTQKVSEHWESKAWNAFGLIDTLGNVQEWVTQPRPAEEDRHAQAISQEQAVCRGGDFASYARYCRSASRKIYGTDVRLSSIGFRVAWSL